MPKLTTGWRRIAMLASVAAFFALILSSSAVAPTTDAATALAKGVSCTEFYVDIADVPPGPGGSEPNDGIKDDINGDTVVDAQDITAIAISRIEPTQSGPVGTYDITTALYLGPDTPADAETLVPNEPPDQGCAAARTQNPEVSNTNARLEYANQFGPRPAPVRSTLNGPKTILTTRSCGFSEVVGTWIRQDNLTTLATSGPTSINDTDAVLYLATSAPAATVPGEPNIASDPTTCADGGAGVTFPYYTLGVSYGRNIRTDAGTGGKNAGMTADADVGAALDSADGVDDDYDGDGCTDWDELDKNFTNNYADPDSDGLGVHPGAQRGMDPFNPNDCNQNVNGNISLVVQVGKDSAATSCTLVEVALSTCVGDGAYFHCLADVDHTKAGSPEPLAFDFACYSDSILSVVNTNYDNMNIPETTCTGAVDEDLDNGVNDGCPVAGTNGEETAGAQCADALDNDGDGFVNDGCAADGAPETLGQCYNDTNDDGDGATNDGCPEINAETGAQCNNATDDDLPANNDSLVNDGCPTPSECAPIGVADSIYCGDGRAGPAPPDANRFASPSDANWPIEVNGTYDPTTGQIAVGGCFEGLGGAVFGPNVFADGFIDLRTGAGQMDLYGHILDLADCQNGLPFPSQGPVLNILNAEIDFTELGNKAAQHDSDFDGCSDSEELAPNEALGGGRDPFNRFDFYDVDGDKVIGLFGDIFPVAFDFGTAGSDATDRAGPIPGGNVWNLPGPDGLVTLFDDIFGVAFQFGHDCTA